MRMGFLLTAHSISSPLRAQSRQVLSNVTTPCEQETPAPSPRYRQLLPGCRRLFLIVTIIEGITGEESSAECGLRTARPLLGPGSG